MEPGQGPCYLKTPLQTFGAVTAADLITPLFRIILVMAADSLGGRARMGREGTRSEAGT